MTDSSEPVREMTTCEHEWYQIMSDEWVGMFIICGCRHCDNRMIVRINRPLTFGWKRDVLMPTDNPQA